MTRDVSFGHPIPAVGRVRDDDVYMATDLWRTVKQPREMTYFP